MNAPQHLIDAARAIQCAAKHYGIPPQAVLSIEKTCIASCRARYAVWMILHKYRKWRLIDLAAEFQMSSSGIGIGIQKGARLIIDCDKEFSECVEKLRGHLKV
jgi:hypothetical protein